MSEQFRADTERLRSTAPAFEQLGAEVDALVQRLRDIVASDIAPWGGDDTGRAFAQTFEPEEKQTLSELNSLTEVLRQAGPDLRQVATNFEQQDLLGGRVVDNAEPAVANPVVPIGSDPVSPVAGSTLFPPADPDNAPVTPARNDPVLPARAAEISDPTAVPATAPGAAAPSSAGETPGGRQSSQQPQQPETSSPGPRSVTDRPSTSGAPSVGPPAVSPAPTVPGRPATATPNSAPAPAARDVIGQVNRTGTVPAGSPATPWSRPASGLGVPRVTAPGTGATETSPPRMPARPARRPAEKPEEPADRPVEAVSETLAARLARELAEQHGVRAFGFDTPAVAREVLVELVAAVHDVLPRHRAIPLRAIGIGEIGGQSVTRLDMEPDAVGEIDPAAGPALDIDRESPGVRITLATAVAVEPGRLEHAVRVDEEAGLLASGSAQRPVYSSIVRELGRALDAAGDFRARPASRRALLAAYLPLAGPQATSTLGRTVTGFAEWRGRLAGAVRDGRFEPSTALAEAFTEVVLDAGRASPAARVLHRLLVETADSVRPRENR